MTDRELRELDAKVHEAFYGVKVEWHGLIPGDYTEGRWRPLPHYITSLDACMALDKEGWEWEFREILPIAEVAIKTGAHPIVYARLWPHEDVGSRFPSCAECRADAIIENGDKRRAYCLARVRCVLQALGVKDVA